MCVCARVYEWSNTLYLLKLFVCRPPDGCFDGDYMKRKKKINFKRIYIYIKKRKKGVKIKPFLWRAFIKNNANESEGDEHSGNARSALVHYSSGGLLLLLLLLVAPRNLSETGYLCARARAQHQTSHPKLVHTHAYLLGDICEEI